MFQELGVFSEAGLRIRRYLFITGIRIQHCRNVMDPDPAPDPEVHEAAFFKIKFKIVADHSNI
jgi:hypothetical protein